MRQVPQLNDGADQRQLEYHGAHINTGVSCSTCHTAHGMGTGSGAITGERLINFDVNVVGTNGGTPVYYNRAANTCTLTCHGVTHNADGTVAQSSFRRSPVKRGTVRR